MSSVFHPAHRDRQPASAGAFTRSGRGRAWRVIHACEYARDVLAVVEGQVAMGMRPFIVTPQGGGAAELYLAGRNHDQPRTLSLLRSWQDVRNWRKSLLDCDPETTADVVHAHGFAPGMAAVRSCSSVAYDLGACIEELAISAGLCDPGSWMARSFRVAEQFVLTRAGAVIVHSQGLRHAALERGAAAESIFVVPAPIDAEGDPLLLTNRNSDAGILARRFDFPPDAICFFVPQFAPAGAVGLSAGAISVLEGFALAANELPQFKLLVEGPESARRVIHEQSVRLGISRHVALVHPLDATATFASAHVVVAMGETPADPVIARQADASCLQALQIGKTLLAADVPRNRDASPEGRGSLWFESGNARDLGFRMAFLGRKPEFRAALGAAGRMYVLESRNAAAVARQYDEAYRYAASRRKSSGINHTTHMELAENWG